jgi:hypothetical protein
VPTKPGQVHVGAKMSYTTEGVTHNYGQLVALEPAERIAARSLAVTRADGARPVKLITHLMEDHMPTAHLGGATALQKAVSG